LEIADLPNIVQNNLFNEHENTEDQMGMNLNLAVQVQAPQNGQKEFVEDQFNLVAISNCYTNDVRNWRL
jgi:hypothetical protein